MEDQPARPADPAAVPAEPPDPEPVSPRITEQERTDLPGLATEHDGRWDYPRLTLPGLPSGAPRPFADGNAGEIHHADARDLLLPAPAGATAADALPSIDGEWVSTERFARVFSEEHRPEIEQRLADDAVRHIAARGWTMPDGTRTGVYLLRFNSAAYPGDFYLHTISDGALGVRVTVAGAQEIAYDEGWPKGTLIPKVVVHPFDEPKPRGRSHVRTRPQGTQGRWTSQHRPGGCPATATRLGAGVGTRRP